MPTGLWDFKDILNSRQNRSKFKLVLENAVIEYMDVARFRVWAPEPVRDTHSELGLPVQ